MRLARIIAVAWLMLTCAAGTGHAEKRVALVVGNAAYRHADVLDNPVNDARGVRDALKGIGFDVIYGENLDQKGMRHLIGEFARTVNGAAVAIVYFAGHGATFGDTPYVVPIDAEFSSVEQVPYELIPLEMLIGELHRVEGLRIAIIDACRDDAAERELKRHAMGTRGGELVRGLAPLKNPEGMIIAYATQYLSTAADSAGAANSPFTSALLRNIATPGLDVTAMFVKVGREVIAATDNKQRPEISISMYEPYMLVPPVAPVQPPAVPVTTPPAVPQVLPPPDRPPVTMPPPPPNDQLTVVPPPVAVPLPQPLPPIMAPTVQPPPDGLATAPTKKPDDGPLAAIPPDAPPAAEPPPRTKHPNGRRRTADRDRHEYRRRRWDADTSERQPPPHAPPVVNDCVHVAFPQCGRSGR